MRINLALARFYKTLIEKNVDANVYDAMKDVKVSADKYTIPGLVEAILKMGGYRNIDM